MSAKGQLVGYIRVSTIGQNIDRQLGQIEADRIFVDRVSGKDLDRPELAAMLDYVREGDTLVVEVTGLHDGTWFDRAGNHHSYKLKVTERYTLTGPDHILYEATMEDPDTFSRPWTISLPLYRNISENARLGQFKCVEFVEELIYGELRKNPIEH